MRRLWAVLGVYLTLSLGDVVATTYSLAHGGTEANPVQARLYTLGGAGALWASKVAIGMVIVAGVLYLARVWWPRLPQTRTLTWVLLALIVVTQLEATVISILGALTR